MTNFKSVKIFGALLVAFGLLSVGGVALGAEKNETPEKLTYKFRALKDKNSAYSVINDGEVEQSNVEKTNIEQTEEVSVVKSFDARPDMTSETVFIKTIDGVTVIGNDPAKAAMGGMPMKNDDGRPRVWVADMVRFEENSFRTNGGNFNRSAVINRMRLNLKMNLGRKATANFSGDGKSDLGGNTQK